MSGRNDGMPGDPWPGQGRCLGGFCVDSPLSAELVVAAAEAEGTPVALCLGPDQAGRPPLPAVRRIVFELARQAAVPATVVYTGVRDLGGVANSLDLGCAAIDFDGSALPFERNVSLTAEAVRLAAGTACRVWGEIGAFGDFGRDDHGHCLYYDYAERFVCDTAVAGLSIALPSSDGATSGQERHRLATLRRRLACDLSLHDASLLSSEEISGFVDIGLARLTFSRGQAPPFTGRPLPGASAYEQRINAIRLRLRLLSRAGLAGVPACPTPAGPERPRRKS
ncbi:class II fructose-bisphosphate aldolase [Solidesulfovibrio sp.]|uniref:class II fructose-bisphosphate aldolase n=1 Tax=Solidesulfovibrio sp. TaxID=2910990 RepID=UPI00260922AA|nr:class II fructose-bisphosphate aldolase [Solidesulfovibrio sp.]